MIEKTFIFLKGISYKKEKKLWSSGVLSWEQFQNSNLPLKHKQEHDALLRKAQRNLYSNNSRFFARLLRLKDNWRLYNYFKQDAVFLDIETVGCKIVLIGIYNNYDYSPFVYDYNLDLTKVLSKLIRSKLLVVFNGAAFDIPRLSKLLSYNLTQIPIFDIRFSLLSAGFSGTLKELETKFNIYRKPELKSVDVCYLWNNFVYNKNSSALRRLISYNFEDTYNLRLLADKTYSFLEQKNLTF